MYDMVEKIGEPAMLEQMAEEASELAKAALKLSRVLRKERPTPVTEEEARKNLEEEYTDVLTCGLELQLFFDLQIHEYKQKRFEERWKAMQEGKEGENHE